jgi:hypothetical protein
MTAEMSTEIALERPSHHVSDNGDKVTIHDLELFVGHIPGFDADDSGMDELDEEAIEQIISRTKAHMSAGSNPKLVMLHQEDGKECPPEALGDIVDIKRKDIHIRTEDGDYSGPGIIGDVVMSRSDFDTYVSTNRFPRRSAEIWKDGHMSEVALLGRETPARPLRDTRFGKNGQKSTYTRPVTFAEVAPGGSNTFVPAFGDEDKKEHEMPENGDRLTIEHDGDDKDLIAKLRAENDTLRSDLEELKMQLNGNGEDEELEMQLDDENAEEAHYQDDELTKEERLLGKKYQEEEDEDKEMFSRIRRTKNGKQFVAKYKKLKQEKNAYRKLARGLGLRVRKAKFSRELDALERDGFRIRGHRDHMMEELLSSKNPSGKIKFWRSTITRDPIGRRLNISGAKVQGKTEYSSDDRKAASDRAVVRMTKEGLAADQFQRVFEQELKTG